ncbi:MAG: 30S ribosomal protein S1 [Gemmatimonadota bacterium]|nr:30S ribosomal protein S1 [Gemmatimonadota bacterium]MXX13044.1 30S ribosomal protein S1 [Gemmatimonadota bacterium]MYB55502.1 30S ribosomal protein S1 [Gemmatimonadota bacterium]
MSVNTLSKPTPEEALAALDESEYSEAEFNEMMELYEETLETIKQGEIVVGTVRSIHDGIVVVDIGFKSEGAIPLSEFGDPPAIEEGDEIEVFLESIEDQEGQVVLSKTKADFMRVWDRIKDAYDSDQIVEGRLMRRIKGGIVVDLFGVDAFLPGSQIDIKQVKNFDQFLGNVYPFRIIKLNKNRRNIVISRRVVLEEERSRLRKQILATLEVGQVRQGSVKNITDFGAFIDLGGLDGLLHITDIAWGRVGHPSEVLSIGEEVEVKVLNYDEKRERISLGMKQLQDHPWKDVEEKYPVDNKVIGKVVSITDYGAFVELEQGVEGLVHISEMSWTQHIRHPSKLVSIGDEVEVMVLRVDQEGQKISLGLKQVQPDPWEDLDQKYPSGTPLRGIVRNLTNFGAFVEIEEGIDGLVHISDMSWTKRIRHPSEVIKKGQELDVIVLNIDKERRRISLGHKQTIENPWAKLAVTYAVGNAVEGNISRILERGVVVDLEGHVEGFVPISQLGIDDLQRPDEYFEEGDEIPLKVVEFDEDQKKIVLSVRERLRDADQDEIDAFLAAHPRREGAEVAVEDEVAEEEVEVEAETEAEVEDNVEAEAEVEVEDETEDEDEETVEAEVEVEVEDVVEVETEAQTETAEAEVEAEAETEVEAETETEAKDESQSSKEE